MTSPDERLRAWLGTPCRLPDGYWLSIDDVILRVESQRVIAAWRTSTRVGVQVADATTGPSQGRQQASRARDAPT